MKPNTGLVVGDRVKLRNPATLQGSFAVGRVVEVINESLVTVRWPASTRVTQLAKDLTRVDNERGAS